MTFEEFLSLVAEHANMPVEKIGKDSSIRDDLGIDSLQLVNLIIQLTERFGVDTTQITSFEDIETVGRMYKTLTGRD